MNEDLTWEVRYEVAKACFYWKKDGQLMRSAEFTQSELEVECERLCETGTDLTQFVAALKQLALSTGRAERGEVALYGVDQRRM